MDLPRFLLYLEEHCHLYCVAYRSQVQAQEQFYTGDSIEAALANFLTKNSWVQENYDPEEEAEYPSCVDCVFRLPNRDEDELITARSEYCHMLLKTLTS